MSNGFVVLMGMGTVFIGLIIIVFLCKAMSAIVGSVEAKKRHGIRRRRSSRRPGLRPFRQVPGRPSPTGVSWRRPLRRPLPRKAEQTRRGYASYPSNAGVEFRIGGMM